MAGIIIGIGFVLAIPVIIYKLVNPPYDPYKLD